MLVGFFVTLIKKPIEIEKIHSNRCAALDKLFFGNGNEDEVDVCVLKNARYWYTRVVDAYVDSQDSRNIIVGKEYLGLKINEYQVQCVLLMECLRISGQTGFILPALVSPTAANVVKTKTKKKKKLVVVDIASSAELRASYDTAIDAIMDRLSILTAVDDRNLKVDGLSKFVDGIVLVL